MKKICLLFLLFIAGLKCLAQQDPANYLQGLFSDLKQKDADSFANRFVSAGQLGLLVSAEMKIKRVSQDSLDKAVETDTPYRNSIKRGFLKLCELGDSLHIDFAHLQYLDCKYEVIKDTGVLCTSLRSNLYFKDGSNFYQWSIKEAIMVNRQWKTIGFGKISLLVNHGFLLAEPTKVTAFETLSKVKITSVVLEPPPPINHPLPPPPPSLKKKKKTKQ